MADQLETVGLVSVGEVATREILGLEAEHSDEGASAVFFGEDGAPAGLADSGVGRFLLRLLEFLLNFVDGAIDIGVRPKEAERGFSCFVFSALLHVLDWRLWKKWQSDEVQGGHCEGQHKCQLERPHSINVRCAPAGQRGAEEAENYDGVRKRGSRAAKVRRRILRDVKRRDGGREAHRESEEQLAHEQHGDIWSQDQGERASKG